MAVNATAVWRVRTGGNNANGGGYDAGIAGAGTDYSQQDAAQLTLTDIACSNTTTVTSATGGFTSAMIGNAIWITGGGASAGPYFITARTDTNTITVDRTPGTVSAGTGRVGGAWANPTVNWNATWMVAGVIMYIRGSGSNHPTSIDYTPTAVATVSGSSTRLVRVVGENGRPLLGCSGTSYFSATHAQFENLCFKFTAATANPPIVKSSGGVVIRLYNCAFDQDGYDSVCWGGTNLMSGSADRCEFFSSTAKRTTNANYGAILTAFFNETTFVMRNCFLHDLIGPGLRIDGGFTVMNNVIVANGGVGVYVHTNATIGMGGIFGCTIAGNAGAANLEYSNEAALIRTDTVDCIIANHGTAGIKYSGAQTAAEAGAWAAATIRRNLLYNNGTHFSGMDAPPDNTTGTDPGFTATANRDYTPNAPLGSVADPFPGQSLGSPKVAMTSHVVPGAIHPPRLAMAFTRTYYLQEGDYAT